MTMYRKIVTVPAVLVDNTWMPDLPLVPKGVNWTVLEYDKENATMVVELWGSDNASVSNKASMSQINAYIASSKGEVLASHAKSPPTIGAFWNGKTKVEEG